MTIQAKRFWSKVDKRGPDECWLWRGTIQSKGYGTYNQQLAHRLAFQFVMQLDPGELLVCHHCDNPPCCNPKHLFLGTAQDNSDDMVQKQRQQRRAKERASRAKLTESDIIAIRNSNETHAVLAKRYGVSQGAIASARTGQTWSTLLEERGDRRHLTVEQVQEIRSLLQQGETGCALADFFDVSEGTISMIRNRRTWTHA